MNSKNWWRELMPSGAELILYAGLSMALFMSGSFDIITSKLPGGVSATDLSRQNYADPLRQIGQYPAVGITVKILFWGGVALLANTIIWAAVNFFIEARNEVIIETEYVNKDNIAHRARGPFFQLALALLLISLLVLLAQYGLAFALQSFRSLLLTATGPMSYLGPFVWIVAGVAALYFFRLMLRLVFWAD